MSGKMKDFFDRTYYAALDRINGRPYATLICAGSDGRNAAQQIDRIATGWRLKRIAEPIIVCTHAQTAGGDSERRSKLPIGFETLRGIWCGTGLRDGVGYFLRMLA